MEDVDTVRFRGVRILCIPMEVRDMASACSVPYHDITGADIQRSVMYAGSRKGQAR